jgi:transposase
MADEDTRSLPAPAQAGLRTRAVRAVLDGMTQAEAARVFGVHHNAVNRWIKRYRQGGWDGLSERRRGRRPGEQAALSQHQQQEIVALVRESTPDQLGLPGFLWTREAVAELIAQRYGVWLARTTVGGYLPGWGFSPQRPQRRALEQNPAAVARWLAEEFPGHPGPGPPGGRGGAVAGRDGRALGCGGRAVLGAGGPDPGHQGDRQALPGQPDQRHLQRRAAAVPAVVGSFSGRVFIDFLGRLLRDCGGRKVHLIVDGLRCTAPSWSAPGSGATPTGSSCTFCPATGPQLHPVELLNHDVKANAAGRRRPRSAGELRDELHGYLRRRQRQPQVVIRFFDHPTTRYAAAS